MAIHHLNKLNTQKLNPLMALLSLICLLNLSACTPEYDVQKVRIVKAPIADCIRSSISLSLFNLRVVLKTGLIPSFLEYDDSFKLYLLIG